MRVPEFNGSLLIYIDGAPIGVIATSVPEKVYGFVELQGDCEKVCLSPVRSIQHVSLSAISTTKLIDSNSVYFIVPYQAKQH